MVGEVRTFRTCQSVESSLEEALLSELNAIIVHMMQAGKRVRLDSAGARQGCKLPVKVNDRAALESHAFNNHFHATYMFVPGREYSRCVPALMKARQ